MKKVLITLSILVLALFANAILTNFNNEEGVLTPISYAAGYGPVHTHSFVYTKIDASYHRVTCSDRNCSYNQVSRHVYDQLDGENSTTITTIDPTYTHTETKVIGNKKCRCGQSSPNNKNPQPSASTNGNQTIELQNPCGHIKSGNPTPRYIDNGADTHIVQCTACGFNGKESHKYKDDVCYLCKHERTKTSDTTTGNLHEGFATIPGFTGGTEAEPELPEVLCDHQWNGPYNGWNRVDTNKHYAKCTNVLTKKMAITT